MMAEKESLSDAVDHVSGPAQDADVHLQRLLTPEVELPWFRSLIKNIQELIHPPKLPPLEVTSKPVQVRDIWGLYGRDKRSGPMSLAIHATVVTLLFTVASSKTVQDKVKEFVPLIQPDIAPYIPKAEPKKVAMGGGGGGGDRSPLPPSKGKLPKQSLKQFTPPTAVIQNENPKLIMDPSIVVPPDVNLPQVNMPQYGDPLAKLGPPSNGPGSGGGIGTGSGGGVDRGCPDRSQFPPAVAGGYLRSTLQPGSSRTFVGRRFSAMEKAADCGPVCTQ
jgi:protein TonB